MSYLNQFVFGIYPYIAGAVFLLGCIVRFEREQYTWKTDSSQLLHRGNLRVANVLFHLGIIGLFFTHLVGLLTPIAVWEALGISHQFKQMLAMVGGGILGSITLIGLIMLLYRRFSSDRLSVNSTWRDKLVLIWILLTLLLGLSTIFVSAKHTDGHEMVRLMTWAQHIVTFRGDAASYVADASIMFKLHLFMGMSLFLIFPFTRLVHIWSGFGTVGYLVRPWQLVRPRK
ncbi:Respiratory nitrate reductase 1 gamma chain [Saezia sanguinis]|uniref:nitrate reductase (quinone) n=1 Tax=Saezia sanguinis TaxID=1965230 RepID=A0A433SBM8_9BURK|nr:respiratory nitrate reductase subunit gamma [Saezia sanguinis]RUS66109.1 Respiratory nitrate reductase 1 gamma chain [Saezia sanguinis]